MSIRDWFQGVAAAAFGLEAKASPAPERRFEAVARSQRVSYPPDNFQSLVREGWTKNEIAFAAIDARACAMAMGRWRVVTDAGDEVPDHPTAQLLARGAPSLGLTGPEVITLGCHYDLVHGNLLLQKVRSKAGLVVELWPMRPDRMTAQPGTKRLIDGYWYTIGQKKYWLPVEDVLHWRQPSLDNDYWGSSPLRHCLRVVAADNEATDVRKLHLQNGGTPSVILHSANRITREDADRARERYFEQVEGNKRGGVVVMDETSKLDRLSFDMNELAMPDLTNASEARILAVLKVPPIVLGVLVGLKHATYSNYDAARRSMWEETTIPDQDRFRGKLQVDDDLGPGPGLRLECDLSEVPAMQSVRNERAAADRDDYKAGIITRDEARARRGLPPSDDPTEGGFFKATPAITVASDGAAAAGTDPSAAAAATKALAALLQLPAPLERKELNALGPVHGPALEALRNTAEGTLRQQAKRYYARAADDVRAALGVLGLEGKWLASLETAMARGVATKDLPADVEAKLDDLASRWEVAAVDDLWPIIQPVVAEAGRLKAVSLGIAFDLDNATVIEFVEGYKVKFTAKVATTAADVVRTELLRQQAEDLTNEELRRALEGKFEQWDGKKADQIARTESQRAANMGTKAGYVQAGVETLIWRAGTQPCEFCAALDGREVGISEPFVPVGGKVASAEDPDRSYTNNYIATEVPPLHPHCYCTIEAGRIR